MCIRYDLYCNTSIFNIWGVGGHMPPILAPHGGVERGSISNINQHGLRMLHTKFGASITF